MKQGSALFAVSLLFAALTALAAPPELPDFLPGFYAPAFKIEGNDLVLVRQSGTNLIRQAVYAIKGKPIALSIENIPCSRAAADNMFAKTFAAMGRQMDSDNGVFHTITETEISASVREASVNRNIFIFKFPGSVQIWTLSANPGILLAPEKYLETIMPLANRQRYSEALSLGNVSMGAWGPQIYAYARSLLEAGKKTEASAVLRNLLTTSPYNYEAHLAFADNTDDLQAATNSAKVVLENAESPELLARAAKFLGIPLPEWQSAPTLASDDTGFQVILVPLAPCSPWFLADVAKVFRGMTDIPVTIRRLDTEWQWGEPDRIGHQRTVEGALQKIRDGDVDFSGWTRTNYIGALEKAASTGKALSRYYTAQLLAEVEKTPGQYNVDPHLDRFCNAIKPRRGQDRRTMYVGITEANIFSGESNFLFSQGRAKGESPASILSYYMMLGRTMGEDYESRQRLVERIAKELVPASFKQLDIPRSTDPRCPYSYSSGVGRLDEKTLKLSDQLKQELEKLKTQPPEAGNPQ